MEILYKINLIKFDGRVSGNRTTFIWEKDKIFSEDEITLGGLYPSSSPPSSLAVEIDKMISKIYGCPAYDHLETRILNKDTECDCGGIEETRCPECGGTGEITLSFEASYCNATFEDTGSCPFCNGTGNITQKNIDKWGMDIKRIPYLNVKKYNKSCSKCCGTGKYEKEILIISDPDSDDDTEYKVDKDLFEGCSIEDIKLSRNNTHCYVLYDDDDNKMIVTVPRRKRD